MLPVAYDVCFFANQYVKVVFISRIDELSEGALTGVAEALRLAAKLLGLGRETSPSAVAALNEITMSYMPLRIFWRVLFY